MATLTKNEKEIISLMENEYVRCGYMYSGNIDIRDVVRELNFTSKKAIELLFGMAEKKVIQKRDCDACCFELTAESRKRLIQQNDLSNIWQDKAPYFYPNEPFGEIGKVIRESPAKRL